jgi:hypothetical protein
VITQQDRDYFGDDFVNFSRRAALEALGPEVVALQQQNRDLQAFAQRTQNDRIQQALDSAVPDWRSTYHDPRFSEWLESLDPYAGEPRSQLPRRAVAAGDASQRRPFYRGFLAEHGHAAAAQRSYQSRSPATSGKPVYTRQQITDLYKRRRDGLIDDKSWARQEADIFAAGREGRVVGALNLRQGRQDQDRLSGQTAAPRSDRPA